MSQKNKTRVLLAEDDPNLGSLLSEYLEAKGFGVTLCKDGDQGLKAFSQQTFDFIILDVMMPLKDGFTLAREIRNVNKEVPILFLTAKSMKEDTLKGFEIGADDYVTKPFSMEELLVRINAILRRTGNHQEEEETQEYQIGLYHFNYLNQRLSINGEEIKLTTKENELLNLLCKSLNGVMERNFALNAIWGDDDYFKGRSMDVYIAKLRKHLSKDPNIEIVNVHGRGFKLLVDSE
ncbi:MAG: DNA-binding response regulator [Cryomorphaceae bacterium]|nr:MAG: DNA-binding response regulator [Cryomorphaceae bacterium]